MAKTSRYQNVPAQRKRGTKCMVLPTATSSSTPYKPGEELCSEGFTFIVKDNEGTYRFVYRDGDYLSYAYYPRMIFPRVTEEHRTLWRRVVIDNVYRWDCTVDPSSMRLIKLETRFIDHTFIDDHERAHCTRQMALAKLTASEAKALGREKEWFGMMLMRKEHQHQRERQLLDNITNDTAIWGVDEIK